MGSLNFAIMKKGHTLNLEYSAGPPQTSYYRYDNLLHVPNGEAGDANECSVVKDDWIRKTGHTFGAQSREKRRQWLEIQRSRKKTEWHNPSSRGSLLTNPKKASTFWITAYQVVGA